MGMTDSRRITKVREGQSLGGPLKSEGYFEFEPADLASLLERAETVCSMSRAVEKIMRRPGSLSKLSFKLNVAAPQANSVCVNGASNFDGWKHSMWSGLQMHPLFVEMALRFSIRKVRFNHGHAIWFCTNLKGMMLISLPPIVGSKLRRLEVRSSFRPDGEDIALVGVW